MNPAQSDELQRLRNISSEYDQNKGALQKLSDENALLRQKLENEYLMSAKLSSEKLTLQNELDSSKKDDTVVQEVMRVK